MILPRNALESTSDKEKMNVTDPTPIPALQSSSQQPNSQPPKQGSSAVKIILIIVAVILALGIAVVGVVGYGIYRVSKAVQNGSVSIASDQKLTEADLGVAIYPGADQAKGSAKLNFGAGPMVTAIFLTPDPKDKVIAFYKDQLGTGAQDIESGASALLLVTKANKESINITISQKPGQYDGKTRITILHSTPNSK
jgi:hypothetical protein